MRLRCAMVCVPEYEFAGLGSNSDLGVSEQPKQFYVSYRLLDKG